VLYSGAGNLRLATDAIMCSQNES